MIDLEGGNMRKKLFTAMVLTYLTSIVIYGCGIDRKFWEKVFPELTYKEAYSKDADIIEDESTMSSSVMEYAAMENENAVAKTEKNEETSKQEEEAATQVQAAETEIKPETADIDYSEISFEYEDLVKNFYQVDKTTTIGENQLNRDILLKDVKIDESQDGPAILIYHTHSQEGYSDSVEGDPDTTVVGVGDYLEKLLTEKYGHKVFHHKGEYDVNDRDHAYSNALPEVAGVINENPQIQLVIDLHRDGVADTTRLATTINGKPTAQIMFFNGLSRTVERGDISGLPNPYINDNLALSFQMEVAAEKFYPGFTRRIYLKGYRYNMHLCPKSMLVEVGAQTNTLEEAMNAMEPLADIIDKVIKKDK